MQASSHGFIVFEASDLKTACDLPVHSLTLKHEWTKQSHNSLWLFVQKETPSVNSNLLVALDSKVTITLNSR